jgi:hypothetical protein
MIQSRAPTASAERIAEEVIGQLIGAEGIDLTLIGSLPSMAETSTDRLSLESLSGDVAVLDWQQPEAMVTALESVGFQGQRAPHPHDAKTGAPPLGVRRVYLFDMTAFRDAGQLVAALRQLNARRQVRTFSIGPAAVSQAIHSKPTGAANFPGNSSEDSPAPSPAEPPSSRRSTASPSSSPEAEQVARPSSREETRSDDPLDLDDLLDQLDRADL